LVPSELWHDLLFAIDGCPDFAYESMLHDALLGLVYTLQERGWKFCNLPVLYCQKTVKGVAHWSLIATDNPWISRALYYLVKEEAPQVTENGLAVYVLRMFNDTFRTELKDPARMLKLSSLAIENFTPLAVLEIAPAIEDGDYVRALTGGS
jgi:hypothetical protein